MNGRVMNKGQLLVSMVAGETLISEWQLCDEEEFMSEAKRLIGESKTLLKSDFDYGEFMQVKDVLVAWCGENF